MRYLQHVYRLLMELRRRLDAETVRLHAQNLRIGRYESSADPSERRCATKEGRSHTTRSSGYEISQL